MTMIYCPECSKEISEKAKSCPYCGYLLNEDGVEYEYMTLIISDCMNKFQTRYWMIPDVPPPGVIPPTIDEIKEIYDFDMTLKQPWDNIITAHIIKAPPPGWDVGGPYRYSKLLTQGSTSGYRSDCKGVSFYP